MIQKLPFYKYNAKMTLEIYNNFKQEFGKQKKLDIFFSI